MQNDPRPISKRTPPYDPRPFSRRYPVYSQPYFFPHELAAAIVEAQKRAQQEAHAEDLNGFC